MFIFSNLFKLIPLIPEMIEVFKKIEYRVIRIFKIRAWSVKLFR